VAEKSNMRMLMERMVAMRFMMAKKFNMAFAGQYMPLPIIIETLVHFPLPR
jgi:hypothetical protein